MKFRLKLKHKLGALILGLVILTVAGMGYYSTLNYLRDKKSYLMDLTAMVGSQAATKLESDLANLNAQLLTFDEILKSNFSLSGRSELLKKVLIKNDIIESLEVYDSRGLQLRYGSPILSGLADFGSERSQLNILNKNGRLIFRTNSLDHTYIVAFRDKYLASIFAPTTIIASILTEANGTPLYPSDTTLPPGIQQYLRDNQVQDKPIVTTKEVDVEGNHQAIISVAPVPSLNGAIIVSQASITHIKPLLKKLISESITFVVFLVSVSMIFGYLFARRLILPIEELTEALSQVAKGHWAVQIRAKTRDEMGRLIWAFTNMGKELEKRDKLLEDAKSELVKKERLAVLGKFSSGIAHEIKNPLNSILGYSQLLQRKFPDESIEKRNLQFIMDETRRASKIINELMTFARQKEFAKVEVNLRDVIQYSINAVAIDAKKNNVQILYKEDGPAHLVLGDRDQLVQVLINILTNAIQAFPGETAVLKNILIDEEIDVEKNIKVSITDNATGIAPENLRHIFEPFFTTKKAGQGTGLGLALAYGIIQQHNGHLSVTSQIGQGTSFSILLPPAG